MLTSQLTTQFKKHPICIRVPPIAVSSDSVPVDGADRQGHTLHEVIEAAANGLSARLRKTRNLPAHFDREWYALVFTESQRIHLHLDKVVRL